MTYYSIPRDLPREATFDTPPPRVSPSQDVVNRVAERFGVRLSPWQRRALAAHVEQAERDAALREVVEDAARRGVGVAVWLRNGWLLDAQPHRHIPAGRVLFTEGSWTFESRRLGMQVVASCAAVATFVERTRRLLDDEHEGSAYDWDLEWAPDAVPHDFAPHRCWRCDATPGRDGLEGLCDPCHTSLTTTHEGGA